VQQRLQLFLAAGQRVRLGILAVLGTALAVGLTNALLVRVVRLAPVIATLATYIVLQGISLLLRETPGGFYRTGVTGTIKTTIGAESSDGIRCPTSPRAADLRQQSRFYAALLL